MQGPTPEKTPVTLTSWSAKRSGAWITVTGFDSTGQRRSVSQVAELRGTRTATIGMTAGGDQIVLTPTSKAAIDANYAASQDDVGARYGLTASAERESVQHCRVWFTDETEAHAYAEYRGLTVWDLVEARPLTEAPTPASAA